MMENKKVGYYNTWTSRYIVSWKEAGGVFFSEEFSDWLKSEGLTDEEISNAIEMATMGKMELERSAAKFVKKEKEEIEEMLKEA